MKYKEPIKGKGMRTLFKNNKYKTYLADEFRTSCKCSKCGGINEKFIVRENPKPYKNNLSLVHGILMCKTCLVRWNRDCNGATNIYKIAKNAITGKERPEHLRRDKKSDVLDDTS
jgi:transposase